MRVLITAGPTREAIDPVRFLSNYSTGAMGAALVAEALRRRHHVTVISGPVEVSWPRAARVVLIESAAQMERALWRAAVRADVVIMAAAVADFRPQHRAAAKLSRRGRLTLHLEATPDLIGRLPRRTGQVIVGFAVETGQVLARARTKLRTKRLDLLLAQRAEASGAPFGRRKVAAWLLRRGGIAQALGRVGKPSIARRLFEKIESLHRQQSTVHSKRSQKLRMTGTAADC